MPSPQPSPLPSAVPTPLPSGAPTPLPSPLPTAVPTPEDAHYVEASVEVWASREPDDLDRAVLEGLIETAVGVPSLRRFQLTSSYAPSGGAGGRRGRRLAEAAESEAEGAGPTGGVGGVEGLAERTAPPTGLPTPSPRPSAAPSPWPSPRPTPLPTLVRPGACSFAAAGPAGASASSSLDTVAYCGHPDRCLETREGCTHANGGPALAFDADPGSGWNGCCDGTYPHQWIQVTAAAGGARFFKSCRRPRPPPFFCLCLFR